MAFTVTVTAFQFAPSNDPWTTAKFNQGFNPTITIDGVSTTPGSNGQPLVWSDANQRWEPGTVGGSFVSAAQTQANNIYLSKKFR